MMEHTALSPYAGFSAARIRDIPAPAWFRGDRSPQRPSIDDSGNDPISPIVRSILDHVQYGAIAIDGGWRISFVNRAAVHECRRPDSPLHIERSQLLVADGYEQRRVAAALDAARGGRWSMLRLGADPMPLTIAVLPLVGVAREGEPLVLMLFGLRHCAESVALQLYGRACRLTPAETRVLRGLADGLAPQEIAERDSVLLSTVRSHIRSIREKTGTRSITELTHTLVGLPAIMPALVGSA